MKQVPHGRCQACTFKPCCCPLMSYRGKATQKEGESSICAQGLLGASRPALMLSCSPDPCQWQSHAPPNLSCCQDAQQTRPDSRTIIDLKHKLSWKSWLNMCWPRHVAGCTGGSGSRGHQRKKPTNLGPGVRMQDIGHVTPLDCYYPQCFYSPGTES